MDTTEIAQVSRWSAITRGLARRCPRCGRGQFYRGYLKVAEHCTVCGEPLAAIRTDDMPSWATILIAGHIVVPVIFLGMDTDLPDWAIMTGALGLSVAMVLVLLPSIKAGIAGLIWSLGSPGRTLPEDA